MVLAGGGVTPSASHFQMVVSHERGSSQGLWGPPGGVEVAVYGGEVVVDGGVWGGDIEGIGLGQGGVGKPGVCPVGGGGLLGC